MKIVADNKIPYLKGVLEPYAEVVYKPGSQISNRDVRDADAMIVRTRTQCNENLLKDSNIKFIATATIGFDHIDQEYLNSQNIMWTNAPGCNSSSVQQYIASVLATLDDSLPEKPTIGIVGLGNVGTKVEKLARILDMEVLRNDPPRERAEGGTHWSAFEEILDRSDLVTLHVPLNTKGKDKTHHMIDEKVLSRIPGNTILINTSRGEVVDNAALKKALNRSQLRTAVLDVWENEPVIDRELLNQVKLGTPHIAGYSRDGKANGTAQSVRAISRFFGLGLENWYPTNIEPPQNPVIRLNTSGKTSREILCESILATYNVKDDDLRLREKPDTFEKQRGDYPARREFNAYRLETDPDLSDSTWQKLTELGFQVAPVREKDRKPLS
jgi:erythronate-4-phosphate dehydrogenase